MQRVVIVMKILILVLIIFLMPLPALAQSHSDEIEAVQYQIIEKMYVGSADELGKRVARRNLSPAEVETVLWSAIDTYAYCAATVIHEKA